MADSLEISLQGSLWSRGIELLDREENHLLKRAGKYNFVRRSEGHPSGIRASYSALSDKVENIILLEPKAIDILANNGKVTQRVVVGNLELSYSNYRIECSPTRDHKFPESFARFISNLNGNPNNLLRSHPTTPFLIPIMTIVSTYIDLQLRGNGRS